MEEDDEDAEYVIPEFTPDQKACIKSAVLAGRGFMKQMGANPMAFFQGFSQAGGVQIPGAEIQPEVSERIFGYVMSSLCNGRRASVKRDEEDGIFETVVREINRAYSETYQFGAAGNPDVIGFRLLCSDRNIVSDACRRLAECDNFGLGAGVFPKGEIIVLDPSCDSVAYFVTVFSEEIESLKKAAEEQAPVAPPIRPRPPKAAPISLAIPKAQEPQEAPQFRPAPQKTPQPRSNFAMDLITFILSLWVAGYAC